MKRSSLNSPLTVLVHLLRMSEVIDFHTGEPFSADQMPQVNSQDETKGFVARILTKCSAFNNDRIRSKIPLQELEFSYELKRITNNLENTILKEICSQVRFSPYSQISFWSLSNELIFDETKEKAERTHTSGFLQVGSNPTLSIVWMLNLEKRKISLSTAEEFFKLKNSKFGIKPIPAAPHRPEKMIAAKTRKYRIR